MQHTNKKDSKRPVSQIDLEIDFRTLIGQLEFVDSFLFSLAQGNTDISEKSCVFYAVRDMKDRTEKLFEISRNTRLELDDWKAKNLSRD